MIGMLGGVRCWLGWSLIGLAVAGLGCAAEPDAGAQVGDASDVRVLEVDLGGSYALHVEPSLGGEATSAAVALLRFRVPAGTSFAAVMRKADHSDLDAFLSLYPAERDADAGDGAIATSKYDQAALPMAGEPDALLVHRSETEQTFVLFAADVELDVRGDFQIDLVELGSGLDTVDLTLTDPASRTLASALREDEPHTAELLTQGALEEGDGGMLIAHPAALASLQARAELAGFVARSNDVRGQLFEQHARAALGVDDAALASQIGSTCGELWAALRSDAHALPR